MHEVRTQWAACFSAVWATVLRRGKKSCWCLIRFELIKLAGCGRAFKQLTFYKLLFGKEIWFDYTCTDLSSRHSLLSLWIWLKKTMLLKLDNVRKCFKITPTIKRSWRTGKTKVIMRQDKGLILIILWLTQTGLVSYRSAVLCFITAWY